MRQSSMARTLAGAITRLVDAKAGHAHTAEDSETGLQETGWILKMKVEEVIDPAENLDLVVDGITTCKIHDGVARRGQSSMRTVAVDVGECRHAARSPTR